MPIPQKRTITVLCLYGSPRKGGNTDVLMDAFVQGVEEAGGVAEKVYLRGLNISPCRELYRCRRYEGQCAIEDDMTPLYERLKACDALVLSAPVMFYGFPALTKAFIDRCQALWCVKYLHEKPVAPLRKARPKAVLLSLGGSNGQKLFDGVRMTFRYFLDALDIDPWEELFIRGVDKLGDAKKHPDELAASRALGRRLVEEATRDLENAG